MDLLFFVSTFFHGFRKHKCSFSFVEWPLCLLDIKYNGDIYQKSTESNKSMRRGENSIHTFDSTTNINNSQKDHVYISYDILYGSNINMNKK